MRMLKIVILLAVSVRLAGASTTPRPSTPYACDFLPAQTLPAERPRSRFSDVIDTLAGLAYHADSQALAAVVEQATALEAAGLGLRQRIILQNQLLQVTWAAEQSSATLENARRLAGRLALPGLLLQALGSEPERGLDSFLGPRAGWIERRGETCGSSRLLHEFRYGGTLGFRPVRTATLRALVAQRVAVDVEGVPHLTPLVDHVEVRGRLDADVPACVLEFDARAQAVGAAAGLRAMGLDEVHGDAFVFRRGDGVGCLACHAPDGSRDGFEDVAPEAVAPLLDARRVTLLGFATGRLASWLGINESILVVTE
ncbi:MAG: hypothetical protein IT370_00900 [Deltaproteobacteria bacterium]|nr:hypothetical protein [Deltaproteobacteria bacterium]